MVAALAGLVKAFPQNQSRECGEDEERGITCFSPDFDPQALRKSGRKFGGRSTHREVVLASQADLRHMLSVAELSGSPRNSLGGDPSAGSPTDTLFTSIPMSPWGVDCIIIRRKPEPGVQSLRVPTGFGRPSLRIVRTLRFLPRNAVRRDPRSSPHIARFVPVPFGSG